MRCTITLVLLLICSTGFAQFKLTIQTINQVSHQPVHSSIQVKGTNIGQSSDSAGLATLSFNTTGMFSLTVTAVGYEDLSHSIKIPFDSDTLLIEMTLKEDELEEVIVQSTRTSRTIRNVPTRVETIELEEIDEKNNMRPSNVAMLLHESTGIQVQQTSATSGNANIRIQGLDGRYTQLLKDGFASFGNFSSGLSVLEIPPLDLSQVEVIKGPASPLYGGGAIAGVVNFISKTPKEKPEYNLILNQSHIGQTNLGGFVSKRNKKMGFTLLGLYNRQTPYDVDKDDFTEIPGSDEITLHPKLFLYPGEKTTIQVGNSFTTGERKGGDLHAIKGEPQNGHPFFEKNKTTRNISTFQLDRLFGKKNRLTFKQSAGIFDRTITVPSYMFSGISYNAFTDATLVKHFSNGSLVVGANYTFDRFNEKEKSTDNRDNTVSTGGLYAQHTWDISDRVIFESGIRFDLVNYKNSIFSNTEFFFLPRFSLLYRYNSNWSSRIGAGIGYKAPTLFTEETETIQYRNLQQLSGVQSEKSYGGTVDLNYRKTFGELGFSFNHMFFFTKITTPLVLTSLPTIGFFFENHSQPVRSMGFETNARIVFRDQFKLFLGYTFTDIKAGYLSGNQTLPLVPKGKLNSALIFEQEGNLKIGLEGYRTGRQHLSNGTTTPDFWEFGLMGEKVLGKVSVYANFENFTDTRQSKYKRVVNGPNDNPTFDEIWTHTEGFIFNAGIKLRL